MTGNPDHFELPLRIAFIYDEGGLSDLIVNSFYISPQDKKGQKIVKPFKPNQEQAQQLEYICKEILEQLEQETGLKGRDLRPGKSQPRGG